MKTAVEHFPKHEFEFVDLIFPAVKRARQIVKQAGGNPDDPKEVVPVATNQNVIFTVTALRKRFQRDVSAGKLKVVGGVYNLGDQTVTIVSNDPA